MRGDDFEGGQIGILRMCVVGNSKLRNKIGWGYVSILVRWGVVVRRDNLGRETTTLRKELHVGCRHLLECDLQWGTTELARYAYRLNRRQVTNIPGVHIRGGTKNPLGWTGERTLAQKDNWEKEPVIEPLSWRNKAKKREKGKNTIEYSSWLMYLWVTKIRGPNFIWGGNTVIPLV